ncbi:MULTISPECIES: AfsR/SARP family transcriptional regulator [Actinomadura]|uniref:DNA-binding transcriptional activator of the SARP family n=2 Tax=Actinomadura madurae TaxID=1993 RepID=A0A1I5Y1E8_9ACTN|nr:AfsR/SARP family transcriptional regulator [Actinomadura madurae]SFQ37996.1 DNA-binding transcriptional activator of the SARP family [Actinomadura madurae]
MTVDTLGQRAGRPAGAAHGDGVGIDLLGTVSIVVQRSRTELRAGKVRAMVATLALEAGRTVSHDELSEELWPGEDLRNPRNALQAHATRIRRILDCCAERARTELPLRAVCNGYVLDIPREFVDGNRFLDRTARAVALLTDDPSRARDLLQAGLALWTGPALLHTRTGRRCQGAAALLEERRLGAWEDLVSARLLLGEERQAIAELQRLVASHPTRERLCELLMLALYRSGRQSEALHLFHRTRARLDEELGVQPGRSLQRLYGHILGQHAILESPDAVLRVRRASAAG